MMRNDYRRALILLRGNAPGYSGHVRLERRTLMGSMYFQVQAPQECKTLRAALAGGSRDSYYACALGELSRDSRGQATLAYSFDPRNICGHELEDYQLIVLTCAEDENCEILLYGNVCGHAQLNWERVRTAVCGLYTDGVARNAPAEEKEAHTEHIPALSPAVERQIQEEIEELREEIEDAREDGENVRAEVREELRDEIREAPGILSNDGQSAGDLLDLDIDLPWPRDAEALRPLFMYSPTLNNPPDDDYIYIAAPMPDESGYPYVAVGILAEDGEPVSVRYALPSRWSAEPPAGLEDTVWVGDGNTGWWVSESEIRPDGAI